MRYAVVGGYLLSRQAIVSEQPIYFGNNRPFNRKGVSSPKFHTVQIKANRHSAYKVVDEDRAVLENKAKNCVTKTSLRM